jgi:arylsulfatase A-like enzyme
MPTFAALLGCAPPEDPKWDGINILPILFGEEQPSSERVFYWNLTYNRFAVRYGHWKLILDKRVGHQIIELFHLGEDPFEERNLALKYPEIVKSLTDIVETQHKLDDVDKRGDM